MDDDAFATIINVRDAMPSRACDVVVDQLRSLIVDGSLPPSSRLPPERELATRFHTSRATISQAVRILSALGLLEIHHGSGVFVRPQPGHLLRTSIDLLIGVDRPSMIQLVEVRGWIEIAATVRAAEIATASDVGRIESAFARLAQERESVAKWLAADAAFHEAVLAATGNNFATTILSSVLHLMVRARVQAFEDTSSAPDWFAPTSFDGLVTLHRRIVSSITERDAAGAREAAVEHQHRLVEHVAALDPLADHAQPQRTSLDDAGRGIGV